jgi:hypothetical protein
VAWLHWWPLWVLLTWQWSSSLTTLELISHMKVIMEIPLRTTWGSVHRFCEMELKHAECFFRLNCHFISMSQCTLLLAVIAVMAVLLHTTKNFWSSASSGVSLISVCCLVVLNICNHSDHLCSLCNVTYYMLFFLTTPSECPRVSFCWWLSIHLV